jgi:hypothetical protein
MLELPHGAGGKKRRMKEAGAVEEIVTIVGNWGFPIAVSIYLLVRIEGKLEHLAECISGLSDAIRKS